MKLENLKNGLTIEQLEERFEMTVASDGSSNIEVPDATIIVIVQK
jgi:hypothetical protein